jgi:hypothetical protein
MHRRYEREEKKETIPIHQLLVFAGDGTWIHAPPVFLQIPDGFPAVTVMFGECIL